MGELLGLEVEPPQDAGGDGGQLPLPL
jgi:hypothetical protein